MLRPVGKSRFRYERELLARGCRLIAGVDEAGRGPLAGPVVAAAVIFPADWIANGLPRSLWGLNDSKQLTPEERSVYFAKLTGFAEVKYAIASSDNTLIDEINILQASFRAMNDALAQLNPASLHVLVDGNQRSSVHWEQTPIIDGDAKSYSIAAASVLAKVTRDRMMIEFDRQWPMYAFAEHKGYGTEKHLTALAHHGPCPLHRRSFAPIRPDAPLIAELFDEVVEQEALVSLIPSPALSPTAVPS
ncbi:MAG TPA: ribonuclease HII [Candidatus Limnocylindria bacterium]|nr:ribonuclease HII [Candidatus Limnocylindria bacterium]